MVKYGCGVNWSVYFFRIQCCKSFTGWRMRDRANVFVCKDWVDTCLEIYEEIFRKFSEYSLCLWIQSNAPHSTYIMNFFYLILCHYEDADLSGWASVGNLLSVPFEWYLNHLDRWSTMDVASTNVFTYSCITMFCMSKPYNCTLTSQNRVFESQNRMVNVALIEC